MIYIPTYPIVLDVLIRPNYRNMVSHRVHLEPQNPQGAENWTKVP